MIELPKLYKKTSTGKIQTWKISVDGNEITTTYGLQLGKKQVAREVIQFGKNIGKSNETTPAQQAELEARSQWEQKVKKGYVENVAHAEEGRIDTNMITGGIDPMLAKSYDKDGKKIEWPAWVQPKLDGHRCIAIYQDGKVTLWSRTRKPIKSMPHIVEALEKALANVDFDQPIILDGELYNHSYRDKFEKLTSLIRQETPKPGHEVVQYWVYDIAVDGAPFSTRQGMLGLLKQIFDGQTLAILDSYFVDTEDEMMEILQSALDLGFEGVMVRNTNGLYKYKRSYDLQKVKVMADDEFKIVDITEGRGKMAGKAMFHVVTVDGKGFRVKMKGALDDLTKYLNNKDEYIGRYLTVKYQNLSAEGIPRFPVGERIREDL